MFVTFEGPEGAGKSTALKRVGERLADLGRLVLCTREPGAGRLGEQIRNLLLHQEELVPETELLLFLADRSNHVATVIRPALASGKIVLCDRYTDSTWVYQGYARDLNRTFIGQGNEFATQGLAPDLTLLFDLSPEIGLSRLKSPDRLDAQPLAFHQRVREGFLHLAAESPSRWRIIDATQSEAKVQEDAFTEIATFLSNKASNAPTTTIG